MESRPYLIVDTEHPDKLPRLVDAPNASRAVRHCSARFVATPASGRTVADLMTKGVRMESATDEPNQEPLQFGDSDKSKKK
jgi:hypothetical protein